MHCSYNVLITTLKLPCAALVALIPSFDCCCTTLTVATLPVPVCRCLSDELFIAGAETEITSLRQRLSERNVSYTAELAKAQAGFEAALALARRDGLDKSELQSEISRLRLELSDLTKTMVR